MVRRSCGGGRHNLLLKVDGRRRRHLVAVDCSLNLDPILVVESRMKVVARTDWWRRVVPVKQLRWRRWRRGMGRRGRMVVVLVAAAATLMGRKGGGEPVLASRWCTVHQRASSACAVGMMMMAKCERIEGRKDGATRWVEHGRGCCRLAAGR